MIMYYYDFSTIVFSCNIILCGNADINFKTWR